MDGTSLPPWLARQYDLSKLPRRLRWRIRYYRRRYRATPCWASQQAIRTIYREAKEQPDYEVDHIVPLSHSYVCGLHCEFNLMIVHKRYNATKSNHIWPQRWEKQYELPL